MDSLYAERPSGPRAGCTEEQSSHEVLLKRLPRVAAQFLAEILSLPLYELQRRVLVQKDWLESYSACFDGIGLSIRADGALLPRDIRRAIEASSQGVQHAELWR